MEESKLNLSNKGVEDKKTAQISDELEKARNAGINKIISAEGVSGFPGLFLKKKYYHPEDRGIGREETGRPTNEEFEETIRPDDLDRLFGREKEKEKNIIKI